MGQLVVSSIVTGSVYAILALGLVAVYKTTRVFNFAQGSFAAVAGYLGYVVATRWEWPFALLVVVGALSGAILGLVMDRVLLRGLYGKPPLELVVVTVGAGMIIEAGIIDQFGSEPVTIQSPFAGQAFHVGSLALPMYGLTVAAITLGVIVAISIGLQRTRIGLQLRATFDDPVAARLNGIRVASTRSLAWMFGGALAGMGGVLLTPILFLSPGSMTVVLLAAFAAAVIGGFSSFYGAIAGGVLLAFSVNAFDHFVSLRFKTSFLYAFLILFLMVRPYGLFGEPETEMEASEGEHVKRRAFGGSLRTTLRGLKERLGSVDTVRCWRRWSGPQASALVFTLLLIAFSLPMFGQDKRIVLTAWLIDSIAVSGVVLMYYYGDRMHLAQAGFMAVGAYFAAALLPGRPGQWWWIIPVGALIAGAVGLFFGLVMRRLVAEYFAVGTLGLGLLIFELTVKLESFTGGGSGKAVGLPTWPSGDPLSSSNVYVLSAVICGLVVTGLIIARSSRVGRLFVAVRDSAVGAESIGIGVESKRHILFAVSCALGGLAGGLESIYIGVVTPNLFSFHQMLLLFAAAILAGSLVGSVWGAGIIALIPLAFQDLPSISFFLFGATLVVAVHVLPRGRDNLDVIRLPLGANWSYPPTSNDFVKRRAEDSEGVPAPR